VTAASKHLLARHAVLDIFGTMMELKPASAASPIAFYAPIPLIVLPVLPRMYCCRIEPVRSALMGPTITPGTLSA
jgi:hypothetical protein